MHITLSDLLVSVEASVNPITVPAAVVFNGHITGLAVTRSLGRRGVPVIALDRDPKGYALASRYVTTAGLCPNVLTDEAGFIDYLIALGRSLRLPAVLFPCNDEWVLTVNRYRADLEPYFLIPFSGPEMWSLSSISLCFIQGPGRCKSRSPTPGRSFQTSLSNWQTCFLSPVF